MRNKSFLLLMLLACIHSFAQTESRVVAFAMYGSDTTAAPTDTGGYKYSHGRGGEIHAGSYNIEDDYPFVINNSIDLETGYNGITKFDSAWDISSTGIYSSVQNMDSNNNIILFSNYQIVNGISQNYFFTMFDYDRNNNLLRETDSERMEYPDGGICTYDDANRMLSSTYQIWDNTSQLRNFSETLYRYDTVGRLDTVYGEWWSPGGTWPVEGYSTQIFRYTNDAPDTMTTYSYNREYYLQANIFDKFNFSPANDTMITDHYGVSYNPNIKVTTRVVNTYDIRHNKIASIYINYDSVLNFPNEKIEWTYNEFNQVTSQKIYAPTAAGGWSFQSLARFYYETYETETPYSINSMTVFPSPAKNNITIKLEWSEAQPFSISIFDAAGRLAMQWNEAPRQQYEKMVYLPGFPSGNYFIRAASGKQKLVKQFVLLN